MSKKLSYEFVKEGFERRGYKLVSTEYINNHTKLEYICPNGHRHNIKWGHFQSGHGCPECVLEKLSEWFRFDIKVIRLSFEEVGYILLSTEYVNAHQQLEYICLEGHKHFMTWNNWSKGYRCPTCANIRHSLNFSGSNHPNWKGGITSLYDQIGNFIRSLCWNKEIFIRDNYICQECGKRGGRLHAHHIVSISKIIKYYNITTIEEAKNCLLLFDINNGLTLCENCHNWVHSNKNINKEFLKSMEGVMQCQEN
jgi:5-methylcytosine-specific restriction endonuclease McrA